MAAIGSRLTEGKSEMDNVYIELTLEQMNSDFFSNNFKIPIELFWKRILQVYMAKNYCITVEKFT